MHALASRIYSGYAPVSTPGPFVPWHWRYKGGVSLRIANLDALQDAAEDWHRLLGCIQRMPYEEREAAIRAGQLVYPVEGIRYEAVPKEFDKQGRPLQHIAAVPGRVYVFDVVSWQPEAALLTLHYCYTASDLPGGNLAYL